MLTKQFFKIYEIYLAPKIADILKRQDIPTEEIELLNDTDKAMKEYNNLKLDELLNEIKNHFVFEIDRIVTEIENIRKIRNVQFFFN